MTTDTRGPVIPIFETLRDVAAPKRFDAILLAAAIAIASVGYYFFYETMQSLGSADAIASDLRRQLVAIIIGLVCALLLSCFDYKYYRVPSYAAYIVSILLLCWTLLFGSGASLGSKSWITGIPFIGSLQPSELTKITFTAVIATFLERMSSGRATKLDYLKLFLYSALPIALVALQGDTGTAIVFIFIFCCMIFAAGLKYRFIIIGGGAALALIPVLWYFVLGSYQKMRILTFLNPELDKYDKGSQVRLAKAAVGAGQVFGRSFENLSSAQFAKVPKRENDFIFTVLAEKAGFVGCVAFIALIVFMLLHCYYVASTAKDKYGAFMVVGLTSMLAFHFIENIGMCIGILPVTGIPLPFVSQGGTAMVTNFIAIGVILSVAMMREKSTGAERDS